MNQSSHDLGLVPGAYVRHPGEPDWGLGQIQSVIADRITVNFENRGKVVVHGARVMLLAVDPSQEEGA